MYPERTTTPAFIDGIKNQDGIVTRACSDGSCQFDYNGLDYVEAV
jgi:hypothetical protein